MRAVQRYGSTRGRPAWDTTDPEFEVLHDELGRREMRTEAEDDAREEGDREEALLRAAAHRALSEDAQPATKSRHPHTLP